MRCRTAESQLAGHQGRAPLSGTFRWECEGLDKVLLEQGSKGVFTSGPYKERTGEMWIDGHTYSFTATDMAKGKYQHVAAAQTKGDMSLANPIFCFRYQGIPYSELAKKSRSATTSGEEATITGSDNGEDFEMRLARQNGRWCVRMISAPFGRASQFQLSIDDWALAEGRYVPTKATFWAGSPHLARVQPETFEMRGYESSTKPINLDRILIPGTIVVSEEGTFGYGKDGKLHLLRASPPHTTPPSSFIFPVAGAVVAIGVFALLFRRRGQ